MSKAKKPVKSHNPPNLPADSSKATRVENVLAVIAPEWPTLTKADRDLFASRYTDARCELIGGSTKSEGVLSDALGWLPIISKNLKANSHALRRYSPERFAWMLLCIRGLADERILQETKGGAAAAVKAELGKAEQAALNARRELLETLEELVDGNEHDEEALAKAVGSTEKSDRIVASIGTLSTLARRFLSRPEDSAKRLAQSVGLSLAEVEAAEEAASALAKAGAKKTIEGRVVVRDTPPVNRIEGRVLLEMKAAMRVFNRANARNKNIPKLVPGEATRAVLASRATRSKQTESAEAPSLAPEK